MPSGLQRTRVSRKEIDVNLEQLRKQARELVRAARSGDAAAQTRLGDLPLRLASAQLVIARQRGFPSWPALVHYLEADVASFIRPQQIAAVNEQTGCSQHGPTSPTIAEHDSYSGVAGTAE
jgi:hypothetical protein